MHRICFIVCLVFLLNSKAGTYSKNEEKRIVRPDTWHAVDGLGRTLPTYKEAGKVKKDKYVGIFYWMSSSVYKNTVPANVQQLLDSVSESEAAKAKNDYYHPLWRKTKGSKSWFWNEPVFGYYSSEDKYVLRKHAEMLADAGVDVIFLDFTHTYDRVSVQYYRPLFETFAKARKQGVDTPQICFLFNMGDPEVNRVTLRKIYNELYSKNEYKELWFQWEGKPLILAYKDLLNPTDETDKKILEFFTYRRPDAWSWRTGEFISPAKNPFWGWLATYPQAVYYNDGKGEHPEQITVSVAQNVDPDQHKPTAMNGSNVAGRNYTFGNYKYSYEYKNQVITVDKLIKDPVLYGLNFQQQWDYAKEVNPDIVFVTGWNEWYTSRSVGFLGVANGFPDQYNDEFSRDIEPSSGQLKDHYYYQLVKNIREYKGMSKPEKTNTSKTIDITGALNQWDDISSYYHYSKSTWERDPNSGFADTYYENKTMRNDIIEAKVASDSQNIYFYVKTVESLTSYTDEGWMRLFIDTDVTGISKNWEGFEYVINRKSPTDKHCYLEKSLGIDDKGIWLWEEVGAVEYSIQDKVLQIKVPLTYFEFKSTDIIFNFKWSDNMQNEGDIMDFYKNGDVAPGGRFMFHYNANANKIQILNMIKNNVPIIILVTVSMLVIVFMVIEVVIIIKSKNKKV